MIVSYKHRNISPSTGQNLRNSRHLHQCLAIFKKIKKSLQSVHPPIVAARPSSIRHAAPFGSFSRKEKPASETRWRWPPELLTRQSPEFGDIKGSPPSPTSYFFFLQRLLQVAKQQRGRKKKKNTRPVLTRQQKRERVEPV